MHNKKPLSPIGLYLSVIIELRCKILSLMSVKCLKNNLEIFFFEP